MPPDGEDHASWFRGPAQQLSHALRLFQPRQHALRHTSHHVYNLNFYHKKGNEVGSVGIYVGNSHLIRTSSAPGTVVQPRSFHWFLLVQTIMMTTSSLFSFLSHL